MAIRTAQIKIGNKLLCVYCLKEQKFDKGSYHKNEDDVYYCNCKDAEREIQIKNKIDDLKEELKSLKSKKEKEIEELEYEEELIRVKRKYKK